MQDFFNHEITTSDGSGKYPKPGFQLNIARLDVVFQQISTFLENFVAVVYELRGL